MPNVWTLEKLRERSAKDIQTLYRNAKACEDEQGHKLAALIVDNGLLREEGGGLPFDHPVMLKIEEICRTPDAVIEAVAAAEKGLPPLAGMEHRLIGALGDSYGGNYTTNHAGRCIADSMVSRGWTKAAQKPMPPGSVAQSATTFVRKG